MTFNGEHCVKQESMMGFRMFTFAVCLRDQLSGSEVNLKFSNLPSLESMLAPIVENLRHHNISDANIDKMIPREFSSTFVDTSGEELPPTEVLVNGQPLLGEPNILVLDEPLVEEKEQPSCPAPPSQKKMCEYCGTLISAKNMARHVTVKHELTSTSFPCGHCGKSFPTKDRCTSHEGPCRRLELILTLWGAISKMLASARQFSPIRKGGAVCEGCQDFVVGSMKQHLKTKCTAKFPCSTCGESYCSMRELNDHLADGHVFMME